MNEKSSSKSIAKRISDNIDDDMNWSPKFEALKQILLDCGIGRDAHVEEEESQADNNNKDRSGSQGNHRVLVFSQMTRMLDVLEDFLVMRY